MDHYVRYDVYNIKDEKRNDVRADATSAQSIELNMIFLSHLFSYFSIIFTDTVRLGRFGANKIINWYNDCTPLYNLFIYHSYMQTTYTKPFYKKSIN